MGKSPDSPASFRPIFTSAFLYTSFYRVYSSFRSLIRFSLPDRPVSALDRLLSIKFSFFPSPFRTGLTNPSRPLGWFLLLSISPKFSILSGIPPFSTNLFRLAYLLALLVGLNLFFLIGALAWFFKITESSLLSSLSWCSSTIRSWPGTSLFPNQWSSCFSAFFRQLFSLCWQPGHLVLLPLGPCCGRSRTKSSDSTGALV